jgi:hypothetical protein
MDRSFPTSPRIDRGQPLQELLETEESTGQPLVVDTMSVSAESAVPVGQTAPRIGGILDKVPWTGGSNLKPNDAPVDVLCFRPENFREMQKQHDSLKKGLPVEQRLELGDGTKSPISLINWITWMMMSFTYSGMDTVFKILTNSDNEEIDLVKNWGKATMTMVKDWVTKLQGAFGDKFDKENLRLSAFVVRGSLGPHLLARVISLAGADATGPELFLTAVFQVSFMTASLVRSYSNQIGGLKLKSIAGENVAKLGEQINELVRQIECSGSVPEDLLFLVAKPYVTGTQETFRTFAQQIYTSIISGEFKGTYHDVVHKMNNFYQNLIQSDDYEPSKAGLKETDSSILQGMIAKLSSDLNQLKVTQNSNNHGGSNSGNSTNDDSRNNGNSGNGGRGCYQCGSKDHMKNDCPEIPAWRRETPKQGEPEEKKVNNIDYQFCNRCNQGKGFWNSGKAMHKSSDHKTPTELRAGRSNQVKATMAMIHEESATLDAGYFDPDAPVEVDFG